MLRKVLQAHQRREFAFTLIEVIVVIVILGVLATIAVPAVGQVQRTAITASIKSDIRNSVNAVLEESDSMLQFTTPDHFDQYATTTNGNSITLSVDGGDEETACIWGSHTFGDNDVESFYWSSKTGTIGTGSCLGLDSDVVTGGYEEGVAPDEHEHDHTDPGASDPGTGGTGGSNPPPVPGDAPPGVILEPTSPPNEPEPTPGEEGTGNEGTTPTPTPTPEPTPPATGGGNSNDGPPPVESDRNKYPVCHKNNGKNSWKLNMLPLQAILNGHVGAHHQGGQDIIPPISHNRFAGQNWNPAGIATFQRYCS